MCGVCLLGAWLVAALPVSLPAAQTTARLQSLAAAPKHLAITTSASRTTAPPGGTFSLLVDVVPDPGIHVYAPGAKDYLAIALTLGQQKGAVIDRTIYPPSERLLFANERVPVYQKPFRLVRQVTVARSVKPGTILTLAGTVDYQACDDKVCFIPASAPVGWVVSIR